MIWPKTISLMCLKYEANIEVQFLKWPLEADSKSKSIPTDSQQKWKPLLLANFTIPDIS